MRPYYFVPIKRNSTPAPIPYIVDESYLPKNQKIIVFLPHSDDGRFFGVTLYLLNKLNDVKLVIMSSGHHGVDSKQPKNDKIEQRWSEVLCWGEMLGYKPSQLVAFRADKTYDKYKIDEADTQKMQWFIEYEKPTMVFVPHISDTAQSMNYNTRDMVIDALTSWLTHRHMANRRDKKGVFLAEYPTNHIPLLPPSDKNFVIVFSNPGMCDIKHEANRSHESQSCSMLDTSHRFAEAVQSINDANDIHQIQKKSRRLARSVSGVDVDANKSRGEHFGITRLCIKNGTEIQEIRVKFPLQKTEKKMWS